VESAPPVSLVIPVAIVTAFVLGLLLGAVLGYLSWRLYNVSTKTMLNNLGELNNHLRTQLLVKQDTPVTAHASRVPDTMGLRNDEIEALIEDGATMDQLLERMSPEDRMQFLARVEQQ